MIKLKENSPVVLFKVHDNDNDFTRCDFAILKFNKELVDEINRLRAGREQLNSYEVTAFYGCVDFLNQDEFAYDSGEENISEELEEELFTLTENNAGTWGIEDINMGNVPTIRTETEILHVCAFGVKFTAMMKFSGIELCTEKISWEQFDKISL